MHDGYSSQDILYQWYFRGRRRPVSLSPQGARLPTFNIRRVTFSRGLQNLHTGNYSRLFVHFVLGRQIGFYIIQVYLPSSLIVVTSWVSFWLSRDATPARVSLGVTTVLTMTTLMTASNSSLPKVSYVKSIDIFMISCFLMVFASLLEFAAVGTLNRKMHKKRQSERMYGSNNPPKFSQTCNIIPPHLNIVDSNDPEAIVSGPPVTLRRRSSVAAMARHRPSTLLRSLFNRRSFLYDSSADFYNEDKEDSNVAPSTIDLCSRIVFPVAFAIFNGIYWGVFLYLRKIEYD